MRKILFRGFNESTRNFEYGYLETKLEKTFIVGDGQPIEVRPDSVGQFTGLYDKNGKMIYELDILSGAARWLERYKNSFVTFKDGSFGVEWYRAGNIEFTPFSNMCNVEFSIIGNMVENPQIYFDDSVLSEL